MAVGMTVRMTVDLIDCKSSYLYISLNKFLSDEMANDVALLN